MDHQCGTCDRWFGSCHARRQHMNALGHDAWDCNRCDLAWETEDDIKGHEVDAHYHCRDCDRDFQNLNNIRMHLNSRAHRPQVACCPFCLKGFTTATGVAHHLEAGACQNASSLGRDEIYRIVRAKDRYGLITKHLIGWKGSFEYEASTRSWNGGGFECYLCHREFTTLRGLNQHLNSPAHQQALYHCPNRTRCGMDFKTLAAIINHLESESCQFMRFEAVQNRFTNIVSSNHLIAF
ncbi:hypothetical protein B0T24DRAFT_222474 [Lasiosphaeria ovina]|uniref:C2H2-type domain-containing protein n=1 Tax=Lasiosphaeria ovina TaxID=92902 RepID=A0AAE0KHE3_9PEZI|nr:hypothetical protein B0T24DRAFT_222474 [Lasiosphaeria ovina]